MRTWAVRNSKMPGFLTGEPVGHDRSDLDGECCYILTCTDIVAGWTENRACYTAILAARLCDPLVCSFQSAGH